MPVDSLVSTQVWTYFSFTLFLFSLSQVHYDVNNFLSFNVNGLGQEVKRKSILENLKKLNCISFLQKTFPQKINENKWKKEWEGEIIFNHGTSNSEGVTILFPKNLDFELCEKRTDCDGRLLVIAKVTINSVMYMYLQRIIN